MELNINNTEEKTSYRSSFLICLFLITAIVAVYWPVYKCDFVKYDDEFYVTGNTIVKSGFNWQSIRWAFTSGYANNWHPVTWISHIIDYQLFKDWAGGHHLVNVGFHILNTLLLFYIFVRMTGSVWPSAFVAAAFALHPLHVGTVAWIAERKDVLSTFFWLLTMWSYVRYVEKPKRGRYLITLMLFILGLMSKPMLVTLPFVLLLLDYWPLERKISYKLLIEKIPFFICSFASCVITFLVQQKSGAVIHIETLGPEIRVYNAVVSYLAYIAKMFWPSRLAVFYPFPVGGIPAAKIIICALLLMLLSIGFIYLGRGRRFFAFGWLWYLGTLVPVIGFVQVGAQAMADRYTYMTLTGLFVIIAWSAKEFIPKWRYRNFTLTILTVAVFAALALNSHWQLKYWKNSITNYEHTLAVTENNYIILNYYAANLAELNRLDEAIERFNESLKIAPDYANAHYGLGRVLVRLGKTQQAIEHFRWALKYRPDLIQTYCNFAVNLLETGKIQEAIEHLKLVIECKPDLSQAHYNLAFAFVQQKKYDEAIASCRDALKIKPDYVDVYLCLAIIYNDTDKFEQSAESCNKVLDYEPNNIKAHYYLAVALTALGRTDETIKICRSALSIEPNNPDFRRFLEEALKKQSVK
jgi:protein O-mannosyl-transferase